MIYFGLFILSTILTYGIRAYANKKAIFDIPNERSAHLIPTPKGGGLAIVIVFYIGLFYFKNSIDSGLVNALLCAIPVALISFIDDIITISSKIRFLVQGASAIVALYFLGGVTSVDLIFLTLNGWWLNILAFLFVVWLTNLYNFLDGIDGYAGSEAVIVGLGLFFFFGNPMGLVVAISSLGFLIFNWDKASIFMGDIGSATLGFIFAIFALSDTSHGTIYVWLVLLSLFWFDATLTLIRRYKNNESITQAHNKHAYQRLVQSGWSHSRVVLSSIAFNLLFFALLYFIENLLIVFMLNLISLYVIIKFIDNKKSFI